MFIKIQGIRYNFEIVSENGEQNVCFYIKAICNSTGRTSCVNNLNTILLEFNVNPIRPEFADSMWIVSKKEANVFVNTAKKFLSDTLFMNYLERRLDENRLEGGWENISAV
ncbi:MAG: hypothetical protein AB1488_10925 [Nitrospirota bacterium]